MKTRKGTTALTIVTIISFQNLLLCFCSIIADVENVTSETLFNGESPDPELLRYHTHDNGNGIIIQPSKDVLHDQDESTTSVIIIMIFLATILAISGLGIGCSYYFYKRRGNTRIQKRKKTKLERSVGGSHRQHVIHQRPLEVKPFNRGIPNWYGPGPHDEDKRHFLQHAPQTFITIPAQMDNIATTRTTDIHNFYN